MSVRQVKTTPRWIRTIAYCARTQRLDELLEALAQERPDLDLSEWSDNG
jgi:hypothetical protein